MIVCGYLLGRFIGMCDDSETTLIGSAQRVLFDVFLRILCIIYNQRRKALPEATKSDLRGSNFPGGDPLD